MSTDVENYLRTEQACCSCHKYVHRFFILIPFWQNLHIPAYPVLCIKLYWWPDPNTCLHVWTLKCDMLSPQPSALSAQICVDFRPVLALFFSLAVFYGLLCSDLPLTLVPPSRSRTQAHMYSLCQNPTAPHLQSINTKHSRSPPLPPPTSPTLTLSHSCMSLFFPPLFSITSLNFYFYFQTSVKSSVLLTTS